MLARGQSPATKQFGHPLTITENIGQVTDQNGKPRSDVQYTTGNKGLSIFIGNGELHYQFKKALSTPATAAAKQLFKRKE